jgi:hypothetical protein
MLEASEDPCLSLKPCSEFRVSGIVQELDGDVTIERFLIRLVGREHPVPSDDVAELVMTKYSGLDYVRWGHSNRCGSLHGYFDSALPYLDHVSVGQRCW